MFREWNIWSKIHFNINFFPSLLLLVHVLNPSFGDMSQHKISSVVVWLHFLSSFSLLGDHYNLLNSKSDQRQISPCNITAF